MKRFYMVLHDSYMILQISLYAQDVQGLTQGTVQTGGAAENHTGASQQLGSGWFRELLSIAYICPGLVNLVSLGGVHLVG